MAEVNDFGFWRDGFFKGLENLIVGSRNRNRNLAEFDAFATFALPAIALGVFPPAASVLLPKRAGAARAASALLTGQPRSAAAWLADGLVEAVTPAGDLAAFITGWFLGARWLRDARSRPRGERHGAR